MWLVDLKYIFECDWLIEVSDNKLSNNKLSNNKLSDNNLASKLVENRKTGPYWEKLCQRSWVRPSARPRAQFFLLRIDPGRQITCLFSSAESFVSSFWIEFSLQPFSNLVYACVWHLGNRKSNQHYTYWRKLRNCLLLRSLFTFYVLCSGKNRWKRRESWKISTGPYAGSGWENPDRWSARN